MFKSKVVLGVVLLSFLVLLLFSTNTSVLAAEEAEEVSYGWLSLVPAVVAIGLCFLIKQVFPSLLIGVFVGSTIVSGWNPLKGFVEMVSIIVSKVADSWYASIILFTLIVGGLIGLIFLGGGAHAFAETMIKSIKNSKLGQLAAYFLGVVIFFDDYSNTAIVGNTLRPLTDKLKISREKFSYIVDSTAAPVATLALVSSWVGYEVGLIKDALDAAESSLSAYSVFIQSIPLKFYSIFALILMGMIILSGRDFGPMLKAELRARNTGKVFEDGAKPLSGGVLLRVAEGIPYKMSNMVIPILALVAISLFGLWYTGGATSVSFTEAISNADAATSLLWGALGAVIITVIYFGIQRIAKLGEMMDAFLEGTKMMMLGILILISAWAIGGITDKMGAGPFVVHLVEGLPEFIIPLGLFVVSCFIAFATGTSWGTMAVGIPIAIPIALGLGINPAVVTSTVLTGAIFGDHCSPISDTTVLSSMFSGSDHLDHVKTQVPYALLSAGVALLGYIVMAITGFNYISFLISWGVGFIVLWLVLTYLSNKSAKELGYTPNKEFWKKLSE